MSIQSIYRDATQVAKKEVEGAKEVPPFKSQADEIMMMSWLRDKQTQYYFESINEEIKKLTEESINLAVSYPQHTNHNKIIQNLVRIDTLKKQLAYGKIH